MPISVTNSTFQQNSISIRLSTSEKAEMVLATEGAMNSLQFREAGNKCYRQAFSPSAYPILAPALRIEQARKAILLYQMARIAAATSGDQSAWLSATKNVAVANLSLASMDDFRERCENPDHILFYFAESIEYFSEALSYGSDGGTGSDWLVDISTRIVAASEALIQYLIDEYDDSWGPRVGKVLRIIRKVDQSAQAPSAFAQSFLYLLAAQEAGKALIKADENEDWRSCLQINSEAGQYLSFTRDGFQRLTASLGYDSTLLQVQKGILEPQIEDLEGDFKFYLARAQSLQHRQQAADVTEDILFIDEVFSMDKAFFVIDELHAAIMCVHDVCLESEAISYSQIGEFYEKVMTMDTKANELYMQCHLVAQTVSATTGANFYQSPWFTAAKDGLERIRVKRFTLDQAEIAKKREPYLAKLKPQLDALRASHAPCESKQYKLHLLLQYLCKTHPSKDPKKNAASSLPDPFDRDDKTALKKATMAAIAAYHPDKQFNKTSGDEWYFLCEEIVKELNGFYEVVVKHIS